MNIVAAVVIPAYNEVETLPKLVQSLDLLLEDTVAIVVVDDSPSWMANETKERCIQSLSKEREFRFFAGTTKGGRGGAVLRGFRLTVREFPYVKQVVQCDSDGSHQPTDVCELLKVTDQYGVVIGSRYLPDSRIEGWGRRRLYFSRFLNIFVPRLLGIDINDITNGLRRYNRSAIDVLTKSTLVSRGFLSLSEELVVLRKDKPLTLEIPTVFLNRYQGQSSVNIGQLVAEFVDLCRIFRRRWTSY
jgi:dolichol-phosphate mannosyltransferase